MTTKTKHYKSFFDKTESDCVFEYLQKIEWHDGIKKTRKAKMVDLSAEDEFSERIATIVLTVVSELKMNDINILGAYINNYRDGNDHAPTHSHPKQVQIIISFGETRTLIVGKKSYPVGHGDVVVFGSSSHSVPKEKDKKQRISIAVFCEKNG